MKHILYTNEDKDAPSAIKDRNGEVALKCCKVCGLGEVELDDAPECPGPKYKLFSMDCAPLTEDIIVITKEGWCAVVEYEFSGEWWDRDGPIETKNIVAWMPCPKLNPK